MKFKHTDFHLHTKWSDDIVDVGPSFEDYLGVAEDNKINICFLEHYEVYQIESFENHPFRLNSIDQYLEELDKIKENYEFVLSGLEVDYYHHKADQIHEFMDEYEKQLDFIAGSMHEPILDYPITQRDKLFQLMENWTITQIVDEFFTHSEHMIKSQIFKNVCHIDTIFRYFNEHDIKPPPDCDCTSERILELGRLCIKNNVGIEYNLSGVKFPIGRSFPSKDVILQLKKEGAQIFIGSDSHFVPYFQEQIKHVKDAYKLLEPI